MRAPSAALLLCIAIGCGDDRRLREWRPEDHAHPRGAQDGRAAPEDAEEPLPGPEAEARAVAALWRVSCASCHGSEGQGGGPGLPPMARVADMTTGEWQQQRSDEQIRQVIVAGRGFMPAFGQQINPRGVAALVTHIRRMGGERSQTPPEPPVPAPEPTPSPEEDSP